MYAYSYVVQQTYTIVISGHFLLFCPTIDSKIKIWKKCNKKPGYNILLPLRTINQDHMRYEVQQTECFCHLGTFFYAILFLRYGLSRM